MKTESVAIRPATPADLPVLLALYNTSRADAGCFSGGETDLAGFAALTEGEDIQVALVTDVIAGFISVWPADRFIHHLYVAPAYQSQGIGDALLQACKAIYGTPLSLKCEIRNHRAQRFYRNRGWRPREIGIGDDGPWERLYSEE